MRKIFSLIILFLFLHACSATINTVRQFGAGVEISFDPRSVGMQIDDSIMKKSLQLKMAIVPGKNYPIYIMIEVIDGAIFITGKVDEPEEKIKITKLAWETKGVRSVKNAISIKGQSNFKSTAKDVLITSHLRVRLISNKKIKSGNYTLETINKNIYIFGIALDAEEKKEVMNEANNIYDVASVIPSIYLVSELSRNKN
jgi:osmotically-inducible protein OsmY